MSEQAWLVAWVVTMVLLVIIIARAKSGLEEVVGGRNGIRR